MASIWFTALSSASRIRCGWRVARAGVRRRPCRPAPPPAGSPRRRAPSSRASCSADGLTGLVSSAATTGSRRSRAPTDDTSTIGTGVAGCSSRIASASVRPSISGMRRSRIARSNDVPVVDPRERLAGDRVVARLHRPARELGREDPAVRRVVVDDQHAPAGDVDGIRPPAAGAGSSASSTLDREVERAALARDAGALRRQRAVHQLGEAAADREPEARAAVPARDRGVHLAERLEEPAHPLRRNADAGVADVDRDLPAVAAAPPRRPLDRDVRRDHDLAGGGELDRVRQQVEDDLANPTRVADDRRAAGRRRPRRPARCPAWPPSPRSGRARPRRRGAGRTARVSRSTLPASIFEKSRMSLMIVSRASPRRPDRLGEVAAARRRASSRGAARSCR